MEVSSPWATYKDPPPPPNPPFRSRGVKATGSAAAAEVPLLLEEVYAAPLVPVKGCGICRDGGPGRVSVRVFKVELIVEAMASAWRVMRSRTA